MSSLSSFIAESKYDVLTYGIYADFSLGPKIYQDVEGTLKDLEIGILGKCDPPHLPFLPFRLWNTHFTLQIHC